MTKKIGDEDTFSLRSSRPGIGHDWIDKYLSDATLDGKVSIEGREYPIPKRYMLWHEGKFEHVRELRKEFARKSSDIDPMVKRSRQDSREINKKSRIQSRDAKEVI